MRPSCTGPAPSQDSSHKSEESSGRDGEEQEPDSPSKSRKQKSRVRLDSSKACLKYGKIFLLSASTVPLKFKANADSVRTHFNESPVQSTLIFGSFSIT